MIRRVIVPSPAETYLIDSALFIAEDDPAAAQSHSTSDGRGPAE
jgi:hypothetical protein